MDEPEATSQHGTAVRIVILLPIISRLMDRLAGTSSKMKTKNANSYIHYNYYFVYIGCPFRSVCPNHMRACVFWLTPIQFFSYYLFIDIDSFLDLKKKLIKTKKQKRNKKKQMVRRLDFESHSRTVFSTCNAAASVCSTEHIIRKVIGKY